jgi:formate hydrogenlyase subunit 3/multisubunit Na+/H+ antiporter MnhD subunit
VTAVLAAALVALLLAAVAAARATRASALLTLLGTVLLTVAGIAAAGGWAHPRIDLGTWLGYGRASLVVDGLAGPFLALTGGTAAAVALSAVTAPQRRRVAALSALVPLATAVVISSDQAFVFLLAWEILSVALFLLATADRGPTSSLIPGYFLGAVAKLGGGALLAAIGLLSAHAGSLRFQDWAASASTLSPTVRGVAFVLLLVAFGSKIGVLPLQVPLPGGYAAAPDLGPAVISVALTAGFYGLVRTVYTGLAPASLWFGEALLVLGALGALAGILYAIAQDEVKRFLGFSTIEHSGIALIGLGVALVGQASHRPQLAAAGLLAFLLHVLAHGVAKTLAFLVAERVDRATEETELVPLGGLASKLPETTVGFGLAVLTLAAIPPSAGFVSEWFTLEALLQGFRLDDTLARLLMALAGALLALTAGLSLLAFAKLFGSIFLGQPRTALDRIREPRDLPLGAGLLAAVALVLGAIAPWEIRWLGSALEQTLSFDPAHTAVKHPLVLGPVYADFSVLAPTWLAVVLVGYAVVAAGAAATRLRTPARRAPIWVCGTAPEPAIYQYTPAGYSNPIRVVLRGLYGFRRELVPGGDAHSTRTLRTHVVPLFEQRLYRPVIASTLWLSTQARRIQSGRLSTYLLYVLLVLLIALALIPTVHR